MEAIKRKWAGFEEQHPVAAKWIYQVGFFVIFSNGVTIFQYLVFTFMPKLLGYELAGMSFMWPKVPVHLFGVDFTCVFLERRSSMIRRVRL